MLTDYFSCYELNNNQPLFDEEKISPKPQDCQIFIKMKVFEYLNNDALQFK